MSDIQELETQKAELQKMVDLRDLILKLSKNHDFRKVIHEEFFLNEAARNAGIGGDPALDENQRKDAMQMSMAGGHLKRYLSANVMMGNQAQSTIIQIDEALEEIRTGEID
jgi:hypothetical protein